MDRHGKAVAVPERRPGGQGAPAARLRAGYVQRTIHELPRGGDRKPWALAMNYAIDAVTLRRGSVEEGMRFEPARTTVGV